MRLPSDAMHKPVVQLRPQRAPPAHYYAENLLAVVETVLDRYGDILDEAERGFGQRIASLSSDGQRLLARLIGRSPTLLREDRLHYPEVGDLPAALIELADRVLIERCPSAATEAILELLTVAELRCLFWDVQVGAASKAERIRGILAVSPPRVCAWRVRRACRWLALRDAAHLTLYRLLFFGDRHQDLTTFVMRDLGIVRFEAVPLCRRTRQFPDRATLDRYQDLLRAQDQVAALGARPRVEDNGEELAELIDFLWQPLGNRLLERRRSRTLNRLGRNLERAGALDAALTCYRRSTLAPARERRMRILQRLGDGVGVDALRTEIQRQPQDVLEADFASRFARRLRRPSVPISEVVPADEPVTQPVEEQALRLLTADGGTGWHLENNLPMALFALAYWQWLFAPLPGAFVNAFQTGPVDLFWPDFFRAREHLCRDPLGVALKPRLRAAICQKANIANRLFNWRRFTPEIGRAVVDAMPESDLRALLSIVREDLAGRRTGFPDLAVFYGDGRYEFVEVKGPGDQLQIHQRLWIQALRQRGLPARVLRLRAP